MTYRIKNATVLCTLAYVSMCIFSACGNATDSSSSSSGASPSQNMDKIIEAAEADASKVADTDNARAREELLLEIKSKETHMRQSGYNNCADTYINTIKSKLDSIE